jgi:uncharacterized surface protein with fasciclin (FAS1) repeats
MSFKSRFSRLAVAVGVAGAIATQIPMSGGTAMAAGDYNLGGGSSARGPIEIAVIGLVGYGIFSTFAAGGAAAAGAGTVGTDTGVGAITGGDAPVYDVASGNPDLSSFADEASKADLKNQLRDTGNYTVFAPTNAAFALLPAGTLADLNLPANNNRLKALMQFHIVPGQRFTIAQLKTLPNVTVDPGAPLTTMTGAPIYIKFAAGGAATDPGALSLSSTPFSPTNETGVTIVQSDIPARNGVIHPIGGVLTPPAPAAVAPAAAQ